MKVKSYLLAARVPVELKRDFDARCRTQRVTPSLVLRKLAEEFCKGKLIVDVTINLDRAEGTGNNVPTH